MAQSRFPGWRHMTASERYNAKMHALFEPRIAELRAEESAEGRSRTAIRDGGAANAA